MNDVETPHLLALHPKALSDEEFSVYEVEFEKVLDDPLCRNIALSGSYGAGKSSVIAKEMARQESIGKRWITVSLATFDATNNKDAALISSNQDAIEAEILRQMVYKIGTSEAPKSGLRRLDDRKKSVDLSMAVTISMFALLTLFLMRITSKSSSSQPSPIIVGSLFVVWLIIAVIGIYHLIRTNAISRVIKRVIIFESELEITPLNSTSPFERCVEEVVYLLNASEIDAVVFEDLDRFNSIDIFEKLRNLNSLTNDSRYSATKKNKTATPLKFFFLIRDGLFEDPHDRTKFFDYIIPVVPYADPNNALDVMRSALKNVGLSVDEGFLYQLSSYIDDPRIIYDIADEAYHYKQALFKERSFSSGDSERLIALLACKAHFPRDFELLQVGRGYLHEVLNGKHRLISSLEQGYEDEREELSRELENINRQLRVSEDELICMYGAPRMGGVAQYLSSGYASDSDPHSFLEAARSNRPASQQLDLLITTLEQNDLYTTRRAEIRGDANRRSNVLRTRLKGLDASSETLRAMTLKQLIDESPNADVLFTIKRNDLERPDDFDELKMEGILSSPHFPMLRFLVSSGYLDESYRRYISNFYSDLLCAEDDDLLSAIRQAKLIDLTYEPKMPHEIIRRMDKGVFARKSIRNPWLISALLDSEDEEKIQIFMSSLKQPDGIRYLAHFIASKQFTPAVFSPMLLHFDEDPVKELLCDEGIPEDEKRCFCKRFLICEEDAIVNEDGDDVFLSHIDADPRFLEEDSRFDDLAIGNELLRVGYRAEAIDFSCASKTLLDFVYDKHLFMPSPSIIDGYLNLKYGVSESLSRGNLITEALKLQEGPIKDVIAEHMEYFISGVVDDTKVKLKDEQEYVVAVLNEDGVQPSTIMRYIDALSNAEIEDVSQVRSSDYQEALLSNQLVKCSVDNIIWFYQRAGNSIPDGLAELIEAKGAPIGLNSSKCKASGIDGLDIVSKLIENKLISNENKRIILNQCGFSFSLYDIDRLDDDTVRAMFDAKIIDMNEEMLEEFRQSKPNLVIDYILTDLDGFLAMAKPDSTSGQEVAITKDEVMGLLNSSIDIARKLEILSYYSGLIRLDESYEDSINTAIALEHLHQSDIANLPYCYEKASELHKKQIAQVFADNIDTAMEQNAEFDWNLLYDSLQNFKKNRAHALRLLAWYCKNNGSKVTRDRLLQSFESAGLQDYIKLIKGIQSLIPDSTADEAMLSALANLGMCGKISPRINANHLRRVYPKGYRRA